ncbi:unnamed protein product [Closterium sp. Naga37s-1]|nr:unnamed protein product [Closterium sp. Naga37s-1]
MLELVIQLDGFSSDDRIKVVAATNRADFLDPALMRSGRLALPALSPLTPLTPCQVVAATNRADILDPALMRSGRLDRKITHPTSHRGGSGSHPAGEARARALMLAAGEGSSRTESIAGGGGGATNDTHGAVRVTRHQASSLPSRSAPSAHLPSAPPPINLWSLSSLFRPSLSLLHCIPCADPRAGGSSGAIQKLVEAVVLPMTHKEHFVSLGIKPPKGVLLYGPPGTGKTLIARACAAQTNATFLKLAGPQLVQVRWSGVRACAAQTNATFLKLAGPQLVQMFVGDGAKLVRDEFQLAKEKSPCIIFIDEIDAIGTKRSVSEVSGDREVQRTMLELLSQLDGFSSDDRIKVVAATNRADILDPALMRSGRLDRKIEFPHPTEEARACILQIHSRKMNLHPEG